jgi:multidrug resistance protein MdtO
VRPAPPMQATTVQALPEVDQGDPGGLFAMLGRELAPTPGRLGNSLRLVALVLVCVSLSEVFRLPEAALSAYIVFFVSKEEAASTILSAAIAGIAVISAVFLTILLFALSLAEPALRIPSVAFLTFLAMFLSRATTLGPIVFAAGFIMAYGLTIGDDVMQLALAPATVGNTIDFALPQLAFIPPEEALVHFLLWLSLIVAMPVGLVILANFLFGRDPAVVLRLGLVARLAAAGRFCAGDASAAEQLTRFVREGTAGLAKLQHLAGLLHRSSRPIPSALIEEVDRLGLVLLAWARLPEAVAPRGLLRPAARLCQNAVGALLGNPQQPSPATSGAPQEPAAPLAAPLVVELSRRLQTIAAAAGDPPKQPSGHAVKKARHLLVPDAWTNPAYRRFAFKVTLAVMLCYIGETLVDWPGIHTCIITCFFVSLDTIGDTVHKAMLRILGCLVGAALGLFTILVLMPVMTDLGELLLAVAAVSFLAAWVATGSARISYCGWQIALAYYLVVLQGYGPTLDMETARDRVVGILIGNAIVYVIFTTIWPVRIAPLVRGRLASALDHLACLFALGGASGGGLSTANRLAAERGFAQAIAQARDLLVNDSLEGAATRPPEERRSIDSLLLSDVQALMIPLSVILDMAADPVWQEVPANIQEMIHSHHDAMARWFRRCGAWVASGHDSLAVVASLPEPPRITSATLDADSANAIAAHLATRAAWYELLWRDIEAILGRLALSPVPGAAVANA